MKVTQYYQGLLTHEQRFWVPTVMRRIVARAWRYKVNYFVKAAFVANAVFYFNYGRTGLFNPPDRQVNKKVVLTYEQMWHQKARLALFTALAGYVCLII